MAGKLATKKVKVEAPEKRDTVLFARIQKKNKEALDKNAKTLGFSDTASYVDAVFTHMFKTGK
jgi:hypothetical protein